MFNVLHVLKSVLRYIFSSKAAVSIVVFQVPQSNSQTSGTCSVVVSTAVWWWRLWWPPASISAFLQRLLLGRQIADLYKKKKNHFILHLQFIPHRTGQKHLKEDHETVFETVIRLKVKLWKGGTKEANLCRRFPNIHFSPTGTMLPMCSVVCVSGSRDRSDGGDCELGSLSSCSLR